MNDDRVQAMMLWWEMQQLQERYVATLDNDRLEDWPELFVDECLYEIMPRENEIAGLPIPLVRCDNKDMLKDRVLSLREANIYEAHVYRHFTSGLQINTASAAEVEMEASYAVLQTLQDGETRVYQTGQYLDRVVMTADGWKYASKRAIYDTLRVQTLLATPV
ncbi:MAG: anthranilate 1,2-dioxygenase small subunit AndAd [Porticoccaceae bacterium]